ncbi:hypothetical protein V6N13_004900 [Hibiscus sabdariffa]|uniref:Uncharacterized protein n=1 Tax=Hibiscus sabdariffa TaxID=183260 RepID=A0ABR2RZX2_9ROSI
MKTRGPGTVPTIFNQARTQPLLLQKHPPPVTRARVTSILLRQYMSNIICSSSSETKRNVTEVPEQKLDIMHYRANYGLNCLPTRVSLHDKSNSHISVWKGASCVDETKIVPPNHPSRDRA